MVVGQQWTSNLLVFSRHSNSAPDGCLLADLLLCRFFRRGAERADEETQHADAAPNCGLRAEVQRLDEWGRSRVQRNELVSMLTQWSAACLPSPDTVWPDWCGRCSTHDDGGRRGPHLAANSVPLYREMPRRLCSRLTSRESWIWNEGMDA